MINFWEFFRFRIFQGPSESDQKVPGPFRSTFYGPLKINVVFSRVISQLKERDGIVNKILKTFTEIVIFLFTAALFLVFVLLLSAFMNLKKEGMNYFYLLLVFRNCFGWGLIKLLINVFLMISYANCFPRFFQINNFFFIFK